MNGITNARPPGLAIGALSRLTECNIETIRYYERVGILPPPPRTGGGHRVYDREHLKRLVFVRRARELGFSLEEIRGLLGLVDGGEYTCDEVRAVAEQHLDAIRAKIADLRRLEATMADMVAHCDRGTVPDCPLIDALFG
jgi:MerR family mercuric resistance operon transcriptional regulator